MTLHERPHGLCRAFDRDVRRIHTGLSKKGELGAKRRDGPYRPRVVRSICRITRARSVIYRESKPFRRQQASVTRQSDTRAATRLGVSHLEVVYPGSQFDFTRFRHEYVISSVVNDGAIVDKKMSPIV
jgi:hypothetical protein